MSARVCDSSDHPMLHCAKRRFPIPASPSPGANQDQTKEWLAQRIELANSVRLSSKYNFNGPRLYIQTGFNLDLWRHHLTHVTDYEDNIRVLIFWNMVSLLVTSQVSSHVQRFTTFLQLARSKIPPFFASTLLRSSSAEQLSALLITTHSILTIVNCTISPLQCTPKRDSVEPRIVHDLSFPV